MLRSLVISSALLALAACGSQLSVNEHSFVDSVLPLCDAVPTTHRPQRTCEALLFYPDGNPRVVKLSGISFNEYSVAAYTSFIDARSGKTITNVSYSVPRTFKSRSGRVVGPKDPDYTSLNAEYLRGLPQE